ncbi:ankyrin repeat-containing domain protein [Lasiosphaeria miniovina]|uniref:Ankyrin repeat-containing domain protein n=1 Tax=Lasiosphaeria miniovina TaxID=1954250 RepID=A0AA40AWX0_9PEZI|nr:ankyrin repeat-containing domain protein [Lasiosphaeria miniovina]KAK0723505.1 ankyrin repeat-containing domain protein [Lasiosphaeria miniovina]
MGYEDSPLILASRGGWGASVQLLLDRGAFADVRDCNGRTPLWNAASLGHRDVAKLLDSGADVDLKDSGGHTPLWAACASLVENEVGETTGIHVPLDRIASAIAIDTYASDIGAGGDVDASDDVDASGDASAADIDWTGNQYCALPSPAATSHRRLGVVKLLLDEGADRESMLLNAVT